MKQFSYTKVADRYSVCNGSENIVLTYVLQILQKLCKLLLFLNMVSDNKILSKSE